MNTAHVHTSVLPHCDTTLYLMVVLRFLFRSFIPILSLYKAAGGRERFEVAEGSPEAAMAPQNEVTSHELN